MNQAKTRKILEVFNRYVEYGGEEHIVDQISNAIREDHTLSSCFFDSKDWLGEGAPSKLQQLLKLFYNHESAQSFENSIDKNKPDLALFHNIYPVGSPALYNVAQQKSLPIIQYVHNFRPFSVSGTLWNGEKVCEESLKGNFTSEVLSGAWQGSVMKSFLFALNLKHLKMKGWIESVNHWIAISDFMRVSFISAGVPEDKITTLKHAWNCSPELKEKQDSGYYLFLSRLVSEKGINTLLTAWALLERQYGTKCPTLLIGGEGSEKGKVLKAAAESQKIQYVGYVSGEKKVKLIRECRAMLAPSLWWEPLGLVTYEAYDHFKPMLAADSGGLSETVEDGITGFLHEPGNSDSLAASVVKLQNLTNSEKLEMGERGNNWLKENACPDAWKRSIEGIFSKI